MAVSCESTLPRDPGVAVRLGLPREFGDRAENPPVHCCQVMFSAFEAFGDLCVVLSDVVQGGPGPRG